MKANFKQKESAAFEPLRNFDVFRFIIFVLMVLDEP
jgi:hypothetical protein